uniref:Serine/threonine-protein kinase PLK1 n=1 Tax=Pan paniscus TaxID=9597 RepID=A0A2R9A6R2_PANPA
CGEVTRAPAVPGKAGVPGVTAPGALAAAPPAKEIPEVLVDPRSQQRYVWGRFLGKGGFAKCFAISDADNKVVFAGKIVPKSLLLMPLQKEMSMGISIHRSLAQQHVVGFHGFFEDNDFVFVVLELCRRRSLLELHKRRKALTEPEARHYVLGNFFLNEYLEVKIGDLGLATKVEYDVPARLPITCLTIPPRFSIAPSMPCLQCAREPRGLGRPASSLRVGVAV